MEQIADKDESLFYCETPLGTGFCAPSHSLSCVGSASSSEGVRDMPPSAALQHSPAVRNAFLGFSFFEQPADTVSKSKVFRKKKL